MRALALLMSAILMTGSAVSKPIPSNLPAKDFWRLFMAEIYGAYNKEKKCWLRTVGSETFCMRPHTLNEIETVAGRKLFITAAGGLDAPESETFCHACNGNIGYFVFDASGSELKLAAQSDPLEPAGTYGSPPGEDRIRVVRIGPNENYGWITEIFDMGQGISVEFYQVRGIEAQTIKFIGQLPKSYSDEGDCENGQRTMGQGKCSSFSFDLAFDGSKPDRISPVVLRASGVLAGELFEKSFAVPFDYSTGAYELPPDLPEQVR
jgi:hypothetical protein